MGVDKIMNNKQLHPFKEHVKKYGSMEYDDFNDFINKINSIDLQYHSTKYNIISNISSLPHSGLVVIIHL